MTREFKVNPCRCSVFDVFQLDKTETDIRAIREAIRETKNRFKCGVLVNADGIPMSLTEAQLNNLEKKLLDPVERLKEEQLAHQAHPLGKDEALSSCLQALAARKEGDDPTAALFAEMQGALLKLLGRFMPPLDPPHLDDNLPWPESPAPMTLVREGLEEAILRDR